MEATKNNKEFDVMKRHDQKNNIFVEQDQPEENLSQTVNTMRTNMCQDGAQHMARDIHNVTRQIILRKYTGARVDKHTQMNKPKEPFMKCAKTMMRQRWQDKSLTWRDQMFSPFTALD